MLKLKICGMRESANIADVAALYPDFMGFIFYKNSKRYVGEDFVMPQLNWKIKKVGVFVNAPADEVLATINKYSLAVVQLHGDEPAGYCKAIKENGVEVVKAFGIDEIFDFTILSDYADVCDYFLFDTKSSNHGGTGKHFDWQILKQYKLSKPFFISGGIGLYDISAINQLAKELPVYAVDINSKFEIEPALKDVHEIEKFIKLMNSECN